MTMLDTFSDFVKSGDEGCKAAFVAAMTKRIQTEGYKMHDLMYEVFCCQSEIYKLRQMVEHLPAKVAHKPKPKPKGK